MTYQHSSQTKITPKKLRRLARGAEKLFVTMTAVAESTFKIPYYYPEVLPLTLS